MPLICQALTREQAQKVNHAIHSLPLNHPLHKETLDGEVFVTEDNGFLVYHSAAGFYFNRIQNNIEETLYEDIKNSREYLCTAFEIAVDDESVKKKLLNRFQESYGTKYYNMIEHHSLNYGGKYIMLVKFPTCVVRQIFAKTGGHMRTIVRGPTSSLKAIPTLVNLGTIQDDIDRSVSVFVTQYGASMYSSVIKLHYDLLREVLEKPNMGITVGPFMVWDP